jgi:hypothetical protein
MKKLIAGFLTALTALLTVAAPTLAATQLGDYPGVLAAADGTLDAYVVVGSGGTDPAGLASDIVGAINVAVRLAEVGKTTASVACESVSGAVDGTEKDTCLLHTALSASTCLPASAVLKTAHYSGLADTTYSWRTDDYDYREQVDVSGVILSHDLAVSNVNGTETMVVETGDVKYQWFVEETLKGIGSISVPNYTYPVNIELLGESFSIVGSGDTSVKMLTGSIGTATATSGITYGDYTVYSDLGADNSWARVQIKDSADNTVDTLIINEGESKSSTATSLTVQITDVRALQDGTVVGTDLVVGPSSTGVVKTYDVTADVTSTGSASDRFPGETDWGIQVASGDFGTDGQLVNTDIIEVVYKPSTTQYLKAGEKLSFPNDYADLGFEGWNTNKFATITIQPLSGTVSAYNYSADTQAFGSLSGFEIISDIGGSILSAVNSNSYTKAYILYNYSSGGDYPVMIGFYDESKQKILVNGSIQGIANQSYATVDTEFVTKVMNETDAVDAVKYTFTLCYSNACEDSQYLVVGMSSANLMWNMTLGNSSATDSIQIQWANKTAPSSSQAPQFRLGDTASSAEADEINVTSHGNTRDAGKQSQDVVDDTGIILVGPSTYGSSDKVVVKIPFKTLKVKIYFGKLGTGVSGDTVTYDSYPSIPLTSAVAKLDSEVTSTEKAKNLISVGGPCVNSITAEAMGLTYPACGAASTLTEDKGLIKAIDDIFTTGKVVVVVAGWEAADTATAASVLQQYDTLLSGQTASAVEVTSATSAGITAV